MLEFVVKFDGECHIRPRKKGGEQQAGAHGSMIRMPTCTQSGFLTDGLRCLIKIS